MVRGARECVGVRFRRQGRGRDGLDCLGVVRCALIEADCVVDVPVDYGLIGHDAERIAGVLRAAGLEMLPFAQRAAGDVLMVQPGAMQAHFAIATHRGLIEANASARRVIERGFADGERWDCTWRIAGGERKVG